MNRLFNIQWSYRIFFIALFLFSGVIPFLKIKLAAALVVWVALFVLLYSKGNRLTLHTKFGKKLYKALLAFAAVWVIRALFYDANDHFSGTPVLTLFGSMEFGVFTYLLPLTFLFSDIKIIAILQKALKVIIVVSLVCLLLNISGLEKGESFAFLPFCSCSIFALPFLAYAKKRKTVMIFAFLVFCIVCFQLAGERALMLFFLLSIMGYIGVKMGIPNVIWKIAMVAGVVISIGILIYSLYYGISIFEVLQDMYLDKDDIVQDTRSFIFYELSEDLTSNHLWLFGKGMLGTCYSRYFDNSTNPDADSAYRIGLEVGFLQYLLKGGLLYLALIMSTFIGAVYNALFRSKSEFMKIIGVLLFANFVLSCVSFGPSFNMWNFHIWIIIGLCFAKPFLDLTDSEIKQLMH